MGMSRLGSTVATVRSTEFINYVTPAENQSSSSDDARFAKRPVSLSYSNSDSHPTSDHNSDSNSDSDPTSDRNSNSNSDSKENRFF